MAHTGEHATVDTRFATLLVEGTIRELHARAEHERELRALRETRLGDEAPPRVITVAGEAPHRPQPALGD
jgi:hypothetical protein